MGRDNVNFMALKQKDISFNSIILWHIDRISKAMSLDVKKLTPGLVFDDNKIYANQVSHLSYLLNPYMDETYKKEVTKIPPPQNKDNTREFMELWFGCLVRLMSRKNMLPPDEIEVDVND